VWDEEALVALPIELYYRHRLSPVAIGYVSHLFVWGEENTKIESEFDCTSSLEAICPTDSESSV
jgi:hypothetical protein